MSGRPVRAAQLAATALVLARLARGRERLPPLAAAAVPPRVGVSVVVPARDEERRIGPCLRALAGEDCELLVVDDRSRDGTARVARGLGATVIAGAPLPPGWVGKPWALQQGAEAASGDVLVCLDADVRPAPGLLGSLVAALDGADLLTVGTRFDCRGAGERLLHPSLLATLVYRYGPADAGAAPARLLANGQCTAVRREEFLAAGGYRCAAGHMTDDVALARALARARRRVVFRQAGPLLDVRMHESARELWREWGRSIAMADVTPPAWRCADLGVVWLAMALPVLRLLARRAGPFDRGLLLVRWALLTALAPSYRRRGLAYWLSPLADPLSAVRLTLSTLRPPRTWRGREYPRRAAGGGGRTARRSGT